APAAFADGDAGTVLGDALRAADVEPAAIRAEAFGCYDAVGPLPDVSVRVARIKDPEARLAVGTGSGNGAASAIADCDLICASHELQFAGVIYWREGEGFLLRPLGVRRQAQRVKPKGNSEWTNRIHTKH